MRRPVREWRRVAAPFRLAVWLPYFVTRTITGAVVREVGGVGGLLAGLLGTALGLAIAIPVTVLVVGFVLLVVPLVLVAVGLAVMGAMVGWPFRPRPKHRYLDWERWEDE